MTISLFLMGCQKDVFETEIPKNCLSWFDGCNNCMVNDGEIGGCTRKFCPQKDMGELKCLKFTE